MPPQSCLLLNVYMFCLHKSCNNPPGELQIIGRQTLDLEPSNFFEGWSLRAGLLQATRSTPSGRATPTEVKIEGSTSKVPCGPPEELLHKCVPTPKRATNVCPATESQGPLAPAIRTPFPQRGETQHTRPIPTKQEDTYDLSCNNPSGALIIPPGRND